MADRTFALGRECTLIVDQTTVPEVADVLVREYTSEIDATGRTHRSISTVVTHRTYEISVAIPEITRARWLHGRRWIQNGNFFLPRIMNVQLAGGLINISENFTLHDVDGDEPLDGPVVARFVFKQWAHE